MAVIMSQGYGEDGNFVFELFDSHYHFPPCNYLSLAFAVL